MVKSTARYFFILISLSLTVPLIMRANGDTIILKDGTSEESDRVWQSENYVHFILKGTQSVEVRFAKEFVERIVSSQDSATTTVNRSSETQASTPAQADSVATDHGRKPKARKREMQHSHEAADSRLIRANKGISFYDPRRQDRYWADKHDRFKTLEEALAKLAQIYGHSVEWVQQNMGEENDLSVIHYNLARGSDFENKAEISPTENHVVVHNQAPVDSPTTESFLSRDGDRNQQTSRASMVQRITSNTSDERQFYDPRRSKKYWISPSQGFDSLDKALAALAKEYNVSVSWVEEHMGDSNLLEDIHQNLRDSLATH